MSRTTAFLLAILGLGGTIAAGLLLIRRAPGTDPGVLPKPPKKSAIQRPVPQASSLPLTTPPSLPAPTPKHPALQGLLEAIRRGDRDRVDQALESLLVEILPPPVPDQENAAILYNKAFRLHTEKIEDQELEWMDRLSNGYGLAAEERAALENLLDRNREVLQILHEAAERPRCNFNLDYAQGLGMGTEHWVGLIHASRLLNLEARLRDGPGVAEAVRAASRLAEATADEPVLSSRLIGAVCTGISAEAHQREFEGEIPVERLEHLAATPSPERVRRGLEKALLFEVYSTVKAVTEGMDIVHRLQGLPVLPAGSPGTPRLEDPHTAMDLAQYVERISQYGALVERPYYEVQDPWAALNALSKEGTPDDLWISKCMLASVFRVPKCLAESEAARGAAQVSAGLRLYRSAHGEYPETLEALSPFMPAAPLDPFTGKPFLYRREGSGFVVYSAGPGARNSGGVPSDDDVIFRSPR